MIKYIKDYINEIEEIYRMAREEWQAKYADYVAYKAQEAALPSDRTLTPEGRKERKRELQAQIKAIDTELEQIRSNAVAKMQESRTSCATRFHDYFHITPEALDHDGLALLNSGILSVDDIFELETRYKDNATMLALLGKEAEKKAKSASVSRDDSILLGTLAARCKNNSPDAYLFPIDNLINWADRGLGGKPGNYTFDRRTTAHAFDKLFPEKVKAAEAAVPSVGAKFDCENLKTEYVSE